MRGDFMCDNERARVKKANFINEVVQVVLRAKVSSFKEVALYVSDGMSYEAAVNTAIDDLDETFDAKAEEIRGALARSLRDVKFDV